MTIYRIIFFILFACIGDNLLAMDAPNTVQNSLEKRGYIFSADIAKELFIPAEILQSLIELIESDNPNKKIVDNPSFDNLSVLIHLTYVISGQTSCEGALSQKPLEDIVNHVIKFIPGERFRVEAYLISDKGGTTKSGKFCSPWHQDKDRSHDEYNFEYLFFMVLEEENFGNSFLRIGLVDEKYTLLNKTFSVEPFHNSDVELLIKTHSAANAGYLINQNFKNSQNKVVVHKTPILQKLDENSRRYKIILRIKLL